MSITNENIPSRYPNRASEDKAIIHGILDEGRCCTIAYVKNGRPYQIPTGYCRVGDDLFIHGSAKSHFLEDLTGAGEVSITITLLDALVLAPTAFDHSLNYRSVMVSSKPQIVQEEDEKLHFFRQFTEKYIPGRMDELHDPSAEEVAMTRVLSFGLQNATSKVRTGPVEVDTSDCDVWTGIVPASLAYGLPESDKKMKKGIAIPKYVTEMVVKSNT